MIDLYAIASRQARKLNVRDQDFDDVVQESVVAMLRASEKLDPNRPERSRRAFLKATAHNAAVDFLRWRGRREDAEVLTDPSALPSSSASAEDEALANEMAQLRLAQAGLGETSTCVPIRYTGTLGFYFSTGS